MHQKRESLGEEGALLGKSANLMNDLVTDDANEQSNEENGGGNFPMKILKDEVPAYWCCEGSRGLFLALHLVIWLLCIFLFTR